MAVCFQIHFGLRNEEEEEGEGQRSCKLNSLPLSSLNTFLAKEENETFLKARVNMVWKIEGNDLGKHSHAPHFFTFPKCFLAADRNKCFLFRV